MFVFSLFLLAGCGKKQISPAASDVSGKIAASGNVQTTLIDVVAAHADASNCWTLIDGSVYDVTSFISKHPGGNKSVLASCGKDATAIFNGKHGGDSKKMEALQAFKVMMK